MTPSRRQTLVRLGAAALAVASPPLLAAAKPVISFGMTPAFVHDQHALLDEWRRYMERRLGLRVEFKQRDSYRETVDLIRLKQLDFAWVCDYPYLHLKNQVRLLAVPLYQGRPYYRSYLIVNANNREAQGMKDLQDKVFAYADPLSNTGYLSPRYRLRQMGQDPARYFRKTFFTWSHKKVVEAVGLGLAQGGAVDSFVWETLDKIEPAITRRTRIIERSPEYGFPPLVAHSETPQELYDKVQGLLIGMPADPEGAAILNRLHLDGFTKGDRRLYDGVAEMMRAFGET